MACIGETMGAYTLMVTHAYELGSVSLHYTMYDLFVDAEEKI